MAILMIAVAIKTAAIPFYSRNLARIFEINRLFERKITKTTFGSQQHQKYKEKARMYPKFYAFYYAMICVIKGFALLVDPVEQLLLPAYFPFRLLNQMISLSYLVLFVAIIVNMVSTIFLTMYFCDNIFQTVYYLSVSIGLALEVVLCCYYGSEFTDVSDKLTEVIYSCNWIDQTEDFKRDLMIFVENCQQRKVFLAGGVVSISLYSFLSMLKTSYSTFTVLNQFGKQ